MRPPSRPVQTSCSSKPGSTTFIEVFNHDRPHGLVTKSDLLPEMGRNQFSVLETGAGLEASFSMDRVVRVAISGSLGQQGTKFFGMASQIGEQPSFFFGA